MEIKLPIPFIKAIFVDCGQGDKFIVENTSFDEKTGHLTVKINKASLGWIQMDANHPIKLTTDCTK